MKTVIRVVPLVILLLAGCQGGSVLEPEAIEEEGRVMTPADGPCNPNAYPC